MQFKIVSRTDPDRAIAEALIQDVYYRRYEAAVAQFPDRLAVAIDPTGTAVCAAGIRTADSGFFSEIYLEQPVEQAIARLAVEPVARETVLEVTTLAALRPGAAFRLIDFIIADGREAGMRWGLFTATRPLRHGLLRAGVGLIEVTRAERHRAPDPDIWGRYYETDPFVCAVSGETCCSRAAALSFDRRMQDIRHA